MKTVQQPSVTHSTFVIERSYNATPERVFAAFSDPTAKRRWLVEGKGNVEAFESDFRVGGRERSVTRFKEGSPFPGATLSNDTVFMDIIPNQRIVVAYTMSIGDRRISSSLGTFEILSSDTGTDLVFTDQGAYFEGADGPAMRQDGWLHLLESLGRQFPT